MLLFVGKRLGALALTLLAVSLLLFLLLKISPGSVATKVLGPYWSERQRQLWLQEHGYFRPPHVCYLDWLSHAVRGDFGDSVRFKVPVAVLLLYDFGYVRRPG